MAKLRFETFVYYQISFKLVYISSYGRRPFQFWGKGLDKALPMDVPQIHDYNTYRRLLAIREGTCLIYQCCCANM